jgi:hypothetical protein
MMRALGAIIYRGRAGSLWFAVFDDLDISLGPPLPAMSVAT